MLTGPAGCPTLFRSIAGLLLVLLVLLPAAPATASARPALALDGPISLTRLEPHVSHYCDPGGTLTIADIRHRTLAPLKYPAISFGNRRDTCWFHFTLVNRSDAPLDLLLRINNPVLDHIELHFPDSSGQAPVVMGDERPFAMRPLHTRAFTVPLMLPAHSTQDYYLKVSSTSSLNLPLQIASVQPFIGEHEREEWLHGAGFGVAAGILIYHLFLWVAVRERVYRFYVLYAAAAFGYLLCFEGMGFRLWPAHPVWNAHAQLFFIYLMMGAGSLFARDFLDTGASRLADRALCLAAGLSVLMTGAQFILPLATGYLLQPLVAMVVISIIAATAVSRWRQGMREARLFVAAWSMLLVLGMLLSLHSVGLTPALPFLVTLNGMEIGFILQQVLLSLALANRLNTLKDEQNQQHKIIVRTEAENAAKTEFLAKMSHEIRTPMNALLGITQLLQDTALDNTQKSYVDTLHSSGHALLHVINDILDYSKISAGMVSVETTDFDLHALIRECVDVFQLAARDKSLRLDCQVADEVPRTLQGDPNRLRQVLLNLLSNAVKFTARGAVRLQVRRLSSFADGRVRIGFEVTDSGIGIPADKIPSLFDWFTQADSSTAREYGGTGLGLAISQQLINLMGGIITVTSKPGNGSTFSFSLVFSPARAEVAPAHPPLDSLPPLATLRVLVVEDNAINQMIIVGLLRKLGMEPLITSSGSEAVDIIRQHHAALDLVLMDCEMPGMDGYQTTRTIRSLERHLKLAPLTIIALTAHALPEHRAACLAAGMDDYLSKPLMLPTLAGKLASLPARTTKRPE
ncbi:MAG: 7TM diverse intracellular signaling domain-containing protein [Gammaproteobacteria bacterium]